MPRQRFVLHFVPILVPPFQPSGCPEGGTAIPGYAANSVHSSGQALTKAIVPLPSSHWILNYLAYEWRRSLRHVNGAWRLVGP